MYVSGHVDIFNMVDIDLFTVVALNMMVVELGYTGESKPMFYNYLIPLTSLDEGLYALACEEDVRCLATVVKSFKLIEVYIEHSVMALDSYIRPPRFRATIEDITNEPELDKEAGFADVARSGVESSRLSHDESFGVDDLDLNINEPRLALKNPLEEAGTQEPTVEDVVLKDYVISVEDAEQGIDIAYETEYDVQSSEDTGTDNDDENEDFLIDEENEIVELDVNVHLFGISMDLPFDNIGVTNLVPDDVLEGEDVDVINADDFDSDLGNDYKTSNYRRRRIRARCDGKVHVLTMLQGTGPTDPNHGMEAGPSGSSGPSTRSKKKEEYRVNPEIPVKTVQDQLQRDLEVQISMSKAFRAKAKAKREIKGHHGWCGQEYKDLLWRSASATSVKDFEKCRSKSDLSLNNICEVFNSKIVRGRDKTAITLLEYIREYCMKRIMNVQSVIDKCDGPLTPSATKINESIKKEAHFLKVQWNGANKYQVSGSFGDQCVVDVVTMTCSCRKWELTRIPYKHDVAACWNMALNDQVAPPPKSWVNHCYWLTTWRETYSHKVGRPRKKIGQDGSGRSDVGPVIGLSIADGQGGAGGPGGAGVGSQGSSHTRWTKKRVQTERISPQKELPLNLQVNLLPILKCR
ncbi:hypothetical protein Tco_1402196 [Tanacetum coccineum]